VDREVILRNVVCLATVRQSEFGVEAFANRLGLGAPEDQLVLGDVARTEWEKARLQVLPDKVQLGFKATADAELVRSAVEAFLERADEMAPEAPIDFNAGLGLTLEEGDPDPSANVVDANGLASALGEQRGGRGGITLVYGDERSRWWIELTPQPDADRKWTFDFNRHFSDFPKAGAQRDEVLGWFADVEKDLLARFETISSRTDR
jgi:hypothetical protein